jgi:hypothetical protein
VAYQVEHKTNLLQPDWLDLGPPVLATSNELSISASLASPQRFYRVVVSP